jgi:peptide/nickel transport system permease protein
MGLIAPAIAPFNPLQQNVQNRTKPPSTENFMGTDELGRDVFSRVLYGAQVTVPAGMIVILIGTTIGTLIGAFSGYMGGWLDETIMRITELFMAFPTIILAMAISAALGPSVQNAILALSVVWWPGYARLMRGLVLEMKSKEFVEGARSIGASETHILFRTILPNCISPAIVMGTLDVGNAILTFAGLSFLGLGPEPSSPDWGRMVSMGVDFYQQWWMWLYAGLGIAMVVMGCNFIGDGLRDFLDPRTKKG